MIPLNETAFPAMTGVTGNELFRELSLAPWEVASQKIIDDLGVAIGTNPGVKRTRNEDRTAVALITAANREKFVVAMVCDGVGGSEMGNVAATLAVATFLRELMQVRNSQPLSNLLEGLIRRVDDVVRTELQGRGTTTASIVMASSTGKIAAANIGDSRIFSWKPDGFRLEQVSVDDTLENELQDLPLKNASVLDAHGLRGTLSQAIGETGRSSSDLRIVVFDHLEGGMILATDGTWKGNESGFKSIALNARSASDAMRRCLAFATWAGGTDNISIIVIDDLVKLTKKAGEAPDCRSLGDARASVWFCDIKLIACESTRRDYHSKADTSLTHQHLSPKKKQQRKSQKPNKSPTPLFGANEQLSLSSDAVDIDKPDNIHPKVEISTDDNDPPSLH